MPSIQAKICGLTTKEAVASAIKNKAAFLGFIFFAASPRNVSPEKAKELSAPAAGKAKTVAVLVNPRDEDIKKITSVFKPDYLQLHGAETPARVKEIKEKFGFPIMKAVSVRSGDDVAAALAYKDIADYILFDSKAPSDSMLPGGNGLKFDWSLLIDRNFSFPWILSGGLNPENVVSAIKMTGAKIVDVSSSLESEPGIKDPALVEKFLNEIHKIK